MLAMAGLAGIVDRVGRRPLLLRGLVAMAACMAAIPCDGINLWSIIPK